jgi:hypothetical protein
VEEQAEPTKAAETATASTEGAGGGDDWGAGGDDWGAGDDWLKQTDDKDLEKLLQSALTISDQTESRPSSSSTSTPTKSKPAGAHPWPDQSTR